MFKRLYQRLRNRGALPRTQAVSTGNGSLDAIARSAGISLISESGPALRHGDLTPSQFGVFECAYAVLFERMMRGATGLAPNFAELEDKAINQLGAGGWRRANGELAETSLAARATFSLLAEKRVGIPRFLKDPDITTIRHTHEESLVALREMDAGKTGTTDFVHHEMFSHPDCADGFVHLYWRKDSGAHTYFNIHLGFDLTFAETVTDAMLNDVVFQTFRNGFRCDYAPVRFVAGDMFLGGRDGIGTHMKGLVLPDYVVENLAGAGISTRACVLSLCLYERML